MPSWAQIPKTGVSGEEKDMYEAKSSRHLRGLLSSVMGDSPQIHDLVQGVGDS